ncbi:MAG: hypothetical protein ABI947_25025 [Chloroflexota bacterium]
MLEELDRIDWDTLGSPQIPIWLKNLTILDVNANQEASRNLRDDLMPWEVFDGLYSERLLGLVRRDVSLLIIPFLIEILEDDKVNSKVSVLTMLYYFALYKTLDQYVAETEREQYSLYSQRLFKKVHEGFEIYERLTHSNNEEINISAREFINLLKRESQNS